MRIALNDPALWCPLNIKITLNINVHFIYVFMKMRYYRAIIDLINL